MIEGWVIIAALAIIAAFSMGIVPMVLSAWSERREAQEDTSSLTTGELKVLINDAVEEAVRPLQQKVERLERRLPEARPFDAGAQEERAPDVCV